MAEAYDVFDLSANWNVNETLSIRAGIDNVLDKDPVITGKTSGYPAGTTLTSVCNGALGCQNPGSYSLGTSGQGTTSGGYYDVLGRRYFLGFKAKF
jgi:outer membrane receptor protein involved in Fe transport